MSRIVFVNGIRYYDDVPASVYENANRELVKFMGMLLAGPLRDKIVSRPDFHHVAGFWPEVTQLYLARKREVLATFGLSDSQFEYWSQRKYEAFEF